MSARLLLNLTKGPFTSTARSYIAIPSRHYRAPTLTPNPSVRILEVGPRDGLQNLSHPVPTTTKIELIHRLALAGCPAIEATSFVPAKWIPQLADSAEVLTAVLPFATGAKESLRFPVLTPNLRGFERAVEVGAREVVVFASASEGFSWRNTNCSVEDALLRAEQVVKAAVEKGVRARG